MHPLPAKINMKIVAIFAAIVWAGLLIVLSWVYRDNMFQSIYDPAVPYQTYQKPAALDYTDHTAWISHPNPNDDPIHIKGGDVFVVIPTFYLGRHHWNAPTDNEKYQDKLQRIAVPNFIVPYQMAGRVFAPNYRQAALYSFLTHREDAKAAQQLAYDDIKRAFMVFMQETPPERPLILIGHGQGGLHVQRLLAEFFNDTDDQYHLRQKLASAYIVDFPLTVDSFDRPLNQLHICQSQNDLGCVNAFGAFDKSEKKRANRFTKRTLVWQNSGRLKTTQGRNLVCVNPLSWKADEDFISQQDHLGGVAAEGLGTTTLPAPSTKQTSAQCQNGILRIIKPEQKSLRRPKRFGGKFRVAPFNLFYEDIRVDMARRVQALIDRNILPRRAPLMEMQDVEITESEITEPLKKYRRNRN